jgi:Spy/CpxP family protein refolding chaperone
MKRTITIFATAALAAGMALAQTAAPHHNYRAAGRQRMMQALNLTDAQKAQAKSIFDQARQSTAPLRAELKQDREALRAAVKADDTAQIGKLSSKEGQVIGKLMTVRTEAMAKFYQQLTPEQRAKADQLHQQWRQEHRARTKA